MCNLIYSAVELQLKSTKNINAFLLKQDFNIQLLIVLCAPDRRKILDSVICNYGDE